MSNTTLNSCGEEVADGNWVALLGFDRGLLEHLLRNALRPNAHVLLPERLHLLIDIGVLQLLSERYLLQPAIMLLAPQWQRRGRGHGDDGDVRHLVNASGRGAGQCGGKCYGSLHLDDDLKLR